MPADANAMSNKRNVVLYLDKNLVEKSKELGFNLGKTFENYLKHLLTQFSQCNSIKNFSKSKNTKWWAGLDSNRRPSARQASGVSTEQFLSKFKEFLRVDLRRSKKTAYEPTYYIKRFLKTSNVQLDSVDSEDIREHQKNLKVSSAQYKNILMLSRFSLETS